jgi:HD superfamily phosphohydrolase YqeK
MNLLNNFGIELKKILDINEYIHSKSSLYDFHMNHLYLTGKYSLLLNDLLNTKIDPRKLEYIAYSHDLFKERKNDSFFKNNGEIINWNGYNIATDLNAYVRLNLNLLGTYQLDDYFNTDIQLHPLSAGIFLHNELKIDDPEILYPVMFHSCPIIPVYEELDPNVQTIVNIIILADKLSSNYLKINMREVPVQFDLDLLVFGKDHNQFNYELGLYGARLLAQGRSKEHYSTLATKFYYNRLKKSNPFILKFEINKQIGGQRLCPKRNSQLWKIQ